MNESFTSYKEYKSTKGRDVDSGLTCECGVYGIVTNGGEPDSLEVAQMILFGLEALQHRGQESTGMVTSNGVTFNTHKGMGLARNVFNSDNMRRLIGNMGIGHTRYSTSAASEPINCQPFVVHSIHGLLAVAHNGELVNAASLRKMVCLV